MKIRNLNTKNEENNEAREPKTRLVEENSDFRLKEIASIDYLRKIGAIGPDATWEEQKEALENFKENLKDILEFNHTNAQAGVQSVKDAQEGKNAVKFDTADYDPNLLATPNSPAWKVLDEAYEDNLDRIDMGMRSRYNVILEGPASVGKTSLVKSWCQENGLVCFFINAGVGTKEDYGGMPYIDLDTLTQKFAAASQLDNLNNEGEGGIVVLLDEFNRASIDVISSLMNLIEEHVVPDSRQKNNVRVLKFLFTVAAVNSLEDEHGRPSAYNSDDGSVRDLDPAQWSRLRRTWMQYDSSNPVKILDKFIDGKIAQIKGRLETGNFRKATSKYTQDETEEILKVKLLNAEKARRLVHALLESGQFVPSELSSIRMFQRVISSLISTKNTKDVNKDTFADKLKDEIIAGRDINDVSAATSSMKDRKNEWDRVNKALLNTTVYMKDLDDKYTEFAKADTASSNPAQQLAGNASRWQK